MKKVYAVSSGCYSGYKVNAIFSTRKLAEEFKKFVPDSEYNDIEEYELDPPTADLIRRGYSIWNIHMLIDGTTEQVQKEEISLYDLSNFHTIWRRAQAPAYKGKGIPDILNSTVWAKTEKQAIKIVNEHRTQMIANGQWRM